MTRFRTRTRTRNRNRNVPMSSGISGAQRRHIVVKYSEGKKLTRKESAVLGHMHNKAFGKKITPQRFTISKSGSGKSSQYYVQDSGQTIRNFAYKSDAVAYKKMMVSQSHGNGEVKKGFHLTRDGYLTPNKDFKIKNTKSQGHEKYTERDKLRMQNKKNVNSDLIAKNTLSENELNLLKNRANNKKITAQEIFKDRGYDNPFLLTEEQNKKGIDFLRDKNKTPTGKERSDNPFGAREEYVLDNFDHFEVIDFYDNSNYYQSQMGMKNYVPLYRAVAKDGSAFEYHYSNGKVNIVG